MVLILGVYVAHNLEFDSQIRFDTNTTSRLPNLPSSESSNTIHISDRSRSGHDCNSSMEAIPAMWKLSVLLSES